MAKTYGELILEYQNFEYSKENYELTKECYELELMNRYVESQKFIKENMNDLCEEYGEFNKNYFIESVDDNNLENISKAVSEKSQSIIKRILNGFKTLWNRIVGFFSKLFNKAEKTNKSIEKTKSMLTQLPEDKLKKLVIGNEIPKENIQVMPKANIHVIPKENNKKPGPNSLSEALKFANNTYIETAGFSIAGYQENYHDIDERLLGLIHTLHSDIHNTEASHLLFALSNHKIKIHTYKLSNEFMSFGSLLYVFRKITSDSQNGKYSIDDANKLITDYITYTERENRLDGIGIDIPKDSNVMDEISKINNELNDMIANPSKYIKTNTDINAWKDIYQTLLLISGNVMKVYAAIQKYREYINNWIKSNITEDDLKLGDNNRKYIGHKEYYFN